jgi:hypothetical protein
VGYNKVGILITDDKSRKYFQSFLEKSQILYSKLYIITLESESLKVYHESSKLIYINIPLSIVDNKKRALVGERIVDFLLIKNFINLDEKCFAFFNNSKYAVLLRALSKRLKPVVVTFLDRLSYEDRIPNGVFLKHNISVPKGKIPLVKVFNKDEGMLLKESSLVLCATQAYLDMAKLIYQVQDTKLLTWYYSVFPIKKAAHQFTNQRFVPQGKTVLVFYNDFRAAEIYKILEWLAKLDGIKIILVGNIDLKCIPKDFGTLSKIIMMNDLSIAKILPLVPDMVILNKKCLPQGDFMLDVVAKEIYVLIFNEGHKLKENFLRDVRRGLVKSNNSSKIKSDHHHVISLLEQGMTNELNIADIKDFTHLKMLKILQNRLALLVE